MFQTLQNSFTHTNTHISFTHAFFALQFVFEELMSESITLKKSENKCVIGKCKRTSAGEKWLEHKPPNHLEKGEGKCRRKKEGAL